MISSAFACKVTVLYICGATCILKVTIFLAFAFKVMSFVHIWCQMHFKVMISLAFAFKVTILYIFGDNAFSSDDFLSICLQSNICTNLTSKAFSSDDFLSICLQSNNFVHIWCQMHFSSKDFLSICLQSNGFVHMWCQMHFQVTIFLAFAFKVMILYIFGAKCISKWWFP